MGIDGLAGVPLAEDGTVRPRFNLKRYFLTACFVIVPLLTIVTCLAFAQEVRADLLQRADEYATRIAHNLHRQVGERFITPLLAEGASRIDLEEPSQRARLDAVVHAAISDLNIERVYFFDPERRIIYSTVAAHQGFVVGENGFLDRALAGEIATRVIDRSAAYDVTGEAVERVLIETYVPVPPYGFAIDDAMPIAGVVEIYQDGSRLVDEMERAYVRIALWSVASMGILLSVLTIIVYKADGIIRGHRASLLRANEQLEQLASELEQRVEQRTAQLVRSEKLAGLGRMTAGMAHEINNPLATVLSCAEGLRDRLADARKDGTPPDLDDFADYLGIIIAEVERCGGILSTVRSTTRAAPPERVDLHELVRRAHGLLLYRKDERVERVRLALCEGELPVHASPNSLLQVILNLTDNALDATDANGEVVWSSGREGGESWIECRDSGPGVPAEEREAIFDPFFTTKPPGKGTGLGLWVAYGLVDKQGGSLRLLDGPPTRFRIVLPAG